MILGLTGKARVGKDTTAAVIRSEAKAVSIAQADPMKWLARDAFGFTPETLWGPSEARSNESPETHLRDRAMEWLRSSGYYRWVMSVLGEDVPASRAQDLTRQLEVWIANLHVHQNWKTARVVLQTLGTECGRKFDANMWSRWAVRTCQTLLGGGYGFSNQLGLVAYPNGGTEVYDIAIITDVRFRNEIVGIHAAGGKVIKLLDTEASTGNVGIAGHKSEMEQDSIPSFWYDLVMVNDKSKGMDELTRKVREALRMLFPTPYTIR